MLCQCWLSAQGQQGGDPRGVLWDWRGGVSLPWCPRDVACASGSVLSPVKSLGAHREGDEPPGFVPITGMGFGRGVMLGNGHALG